VFATRAVGLAIVLMVALTVGALAGCGAQEPAGSETDSGAEPAEGPQEILIGTVLPLTGKESRIGNYQLDGYELAIEQWNEKGGIYVKEFDRRIPIRLISYDDETDQAKTVSLTERLVTVDNVTALLGGYTTTLVFAQSVVPEKYGVPYVNGGGAATKIYDRGFKYVFGTLSPIEILAKTEMDFLKEQIDAGNLPKPSTIVLLWENTSHGKDFQAGVRAKVEEYPDYFEILLDESFELHASDFSALLNKVNSLEADLFLVDAHLPDYILMHRQYTEKGMYHKFITYGARGPDPAAKDALGAATDYVAAAVWWTPDLPYPQVQQFNQDFMEFTERKYGEAKPPQWYAAVTYEAARALFTAIEQAGTLDRDAIRDALDNLVLEPSILPGQRLTFSDSGQALNPFVVVQNMPGGETVIIYPEDAKTGEPVVPVPAK